VNSKIILLATFSGLLVSPPFRLSTEAQGMPPEARRNIHRLFDGHEGLRREVTTIPDGYVALTESDSPELATALKAHVAQMEERLGKGLPVRLHDPAFAEYVKHRKDITHKVEATGKGLKVTVRGKTPEAVEVARNHAKVVTDFASHGWEAHDRDHPAALKPTRAPAAVQPLEELAELAGKPRGCRVGGPCCNGPEPASPTTNTVHGSKAHAAPATGHP
jgi:hypothetical protein